MTVEYGDPRIRIVEDVIAAHLPKRVNTDSDGFSRCRCECGSGQTGSPWDGGWNHDHSAPLSNVDQAKAEHRQHVAIQILEALDRVDTCPACGVQSRGLRSFGRLPRGTPTTKVAGLTVCDHVWHSERP